MIGHLPSTIRRQHPHLHPVLCALGHVTLVSRPDYRAPVSVRHRCRQVKKSVHRRHPRGGIRTLIIQRHAHSLVRQVVALAEGHYITANTGPKSRDEELARPHAVGLLVIVVGAAHNHYVAATLGGKTHASIMSDGYVHVSPSTSRRVSLDRRSLRCRRRLYPLKSYRWPVGARHALAGGLREHESKSPDRAVIDADAATSTEIRVDPWLAVAV